MRFTSFTVALTATLAVASPIEQLYTIELAPGETKKVKESEKWALKAVCAHTLLIQQMEKRAYYSLGWYTLHGYHRLYGTP